MKLRYFCDLCGTEVPKNTIRCPSCGRYFTAIQCPRCGFRGEEKDFAQGCPKCGYMKISRPTTAGIVGRSTRAGRRSARSADRSRRKRTAPARSPLREQPPAPSAPVGVYRLIGIVLTLILVALVVLLFVR
jgi:DNA-directed RNA polymerase subunit RPC12/RpoP